MMNILRKYLFFILLFTSMKTDAQFMIRRTYGFGSINDGRCVIQTSDNGYAICGTTTPYSGGQTNFYLVKTDSTGVPAFHYAYGGNGIDQAYSIAQMPDSGFLISGYSNSFSINNDYDGLLVRTDKLGNSLWTKTFGTSSWDFIYDMKATPDGNFILAGNSYGSSNGSSAGYVVKIDIAGNLLWEKFIESDRLITLKQIAVRNDGSFSVCGNISPSVSYPADGFIAFLDSNGDTLRTINIDYGNHEKINAIDYFSNGDLALAGSSIDSVLGYESGMILRLNSNGNTVWTFTFDTTGTNVFNDLFIFNDTLVAVGSTTTYAQGRSDFHINLFDSNGAYFDGNTYGGSENEFCNHALFSNDGGYVLVGSSTTYGPGQQSVFLVKSDSLFTFDPNVIIDVEELNDQSFYDIYPNPSAALINIYSKTYSGQVKLRLFATDGKLVFANKNIQIPATIGLPELNPGIYFIEIISGNFSERKRIIISK